MKKRLPIIIIAAFIALLLPISARAQEGQPPELTLKLRRDFGYGGFSGDIQGAFTLRAESPDDLVEVRFYIDDEWIGTDTEADFAIQFNTGNFEAGIHTLSAVGLRADGSEVRSQGLTREFLSGDQAMGSIVALLVPLLGVILLLTLAGSLLPMITGRGGKKHPVGQYGLSGGTVCPRCDLPYSRPTLGLNLGLGKLGRCPHCGKWAIVRRARPGELAEAEDRLRVDVAGGQVEAKPDEEESLRRALEDSRFDD